MKFKIKKEEYLALSEETKKLYIKTADGYQLDLEDWEEPEDTGALNRALERERAENKENKEKLRKAEEKLNDIDTVDARKKGDIEALETSWKDKLTKQKEKYEEKLTSYKSHLTKHLVDNVAIEVASSIIKQGVSPKLLLPHVKSRLEANFDGEEPVTRILDKDGKASALSIDELKKEFLANPDYSSILSGSKASGGTGGPGTGSAVPLQTLNDGKPVDLSKLGPKELAAHMKAVRESQGLSSEGE